jgi:hypothetical protein
VPANAPAGSPTAATVRPTPGLAILAPATMPPVSAECTEQVTYDADGNVSPLTCTNAGVNTIAWHAYAYGQSGTTPDGSELLKLGQYASPTQVYQAMCYDYANVYKTKSVTESAEVIAAAYYGWQFAGGSPAAEFVMDGCPLVLLLSVPRKSPASALLRGRAPQRARRVPVRRPLSREEAARHRASPRRPRRRHPMTMP